MSKKCIYGGAELEDDDLFCDVCGRKQEENTSHKAVQTSSQEEISAVEEKTKEEVVLDVSQATEPEPQQASEAKDIVEVKMSEPEKAEEKPEQKSEKVLRNDTAKAVTTQPKSGIRKVRDIVLWILTVVMVLSVVVAVISGMGVMSVAYIIAAVVLCPKFKPEMGFWKRILIMFGAWIAVSVVLTIL